MEPLKSRVIKEELKKLNCCKNDIYEISELSSSARLLETGFDENQIYNRVLSKNESEKFDNIAIKRTNSKISLNKSKIFEKYKLTPNDLSILNKNKYSTIVPTIANTLNTATSKKLKPNVELALSENYKINRQLISFFKKEFNFLMKEIRTLTKKIEQDDEHEERYSEWRFFGAVLDRFFIVIFSILTFTSTCAILFSSQNFFKIN